MKPIAFVLGLYLLVGGMLGFIILFWWPAVAIAWLGMGLLAWGCDEEPAP